MTNLLDLLRDLSEAHGPSGFEGPVRDIMHRELEPLSKKVSTLSTTISSPVIRKVRFLIFTVVILSIYRKFGFQC